MKAIRSKCYILFILLGLTFLSKLIEAQGVNSKIDACYQHYLSGKYEDARLLLNQVNLSKLTQNDKASYFALQARLAFIYEEQENARQWLNDLKHVAPQYQFDVYTDPPQLLSTWNQIQSQSKSTLLDEEEAASKSTDSKGISLEPDNKNFREQSDYVMNYMPFGIGSFHNRNYLSGSLYTIIDLYLIFSYGSSSFAESKEGITRISQAFFLFGSWGSQIQSNFESSNLQSPAMLYNFPLGSGQKRNGEFRKGYFFQFLQIATLWLAVSEYDNNENLSDIFLTTAALSYGYSIFDGYYNRHLGESTSINAEKKSDDLKYLALSPAMLKPRYRMLDRYLPIQSNTYLGIDFKYSF